MVIPFLLFGLSHVVQPVLWRDFFVYLVGLGPKGLIRDHANRHTDQSVCRSSPGD